MYSTEVYLLVALILGLVYFKCKSLWRARNYPPGPRGIPFLGNMLAIREQAPLKLMELGKKYGPIFSVKLGGQLVVVLDDPAIIKEALALEPFLRRPSSLTFTIASGGKYGIAFSDGHVWKEQRSFALQQLVGLGVRSDAMEEYILHEVTELGNWMRDRNGAAFSLNRRLQLYILNSLWEIVGGQRFQPDDPYLKKIMDQQNEAIQDSVSAALVFAFPNLAQKFPKLLGWEKLQGALAPLKAFLNAQIKNHVGNKNVDEEDGDFIDKYVRKIGETRNPDSSFFGDAGWKSLSASLMDFYGAGSETTSTAMTWAILYLATDLVSQRKLQQEIDDVIGKYGRPSFSHKTRMPYTQAVILEVLRCASLPNLTLFRESNKDVSFQEYLIPKGAYITANLYSIHHKESIWGPDAGEFRPERFLAKDGVKVEKREELLAFGSRGRRCIGEGWSLDVMFLFIVELFRRFNISAVGNPSLEQAFAFVAAPKPYEIIALERE